jgi:glycosyltransferase involved in cell wall biosynthesis
MNEICESSAREILLTAIVPVGDMQGRLEKLESWLSQIKNHPIAAIIACDTKNGRECFAELVKLIESLNNQNIILISDDFGGPGLARNAGLELAESDWITFWDSDDVPIWENVLEVIRGVDSQTQVLIGRFEILKLNNYSKLVESVPRESGSDLNLESIALNPGLWRMAFKREIAIRHRFKDLRMGEDQVFIMEANLPELRIHYSEIVFYHYFTGHSGQLTQSREAISDLIQTISNSLGLLIGASLPSKRFFAIFTARQIATLLKRARWCDRGKFVIYGIRKITRLNVRDIYILIGAFAIVLKANS